MHHETLTLGELTCRVIGPPESQPPEAVVLLCHGFGAPGTDLVPLADEFVRCHPALENRVQFVFPEGPLTVPEVPGGRAWWLINMLKLQSSLAEGRFRDVTRKIPPKLPDARNRLMTLVELLQDNTGLPLSRFVLGGFSQGAMLTTDVTLHLPETPGALLIYSGTLVAESEWKELAPARAGLPVLQTHGTFDPLLPFEAAEWLRDLLTEAGLDVDFRSFPGIHTIPGEAIPASAELIGTLLPDAP